jgi:hypothetical protein
VARVGEHDTAFSHRQTPFDIDVFGIWTDPKESDRHLQWGRGFGAALQPFSRGAYINEMGAEGDERIRAAYHPANYARLVSSRTSTIHQLLADEPEHQADRVERAGRGLHVWHYTCGE